MWRDGTTAASSSIVVAWNMNIIIKPFCVCLQTLRLFHSLALNNLVTMHTPIFFPLTASTPHHRARISSFFKRKKTTIMDAMMRRSVDKTLNIFKYKFERRNVRNGWCWRKEEATCGKFKAHHVKNYSTTHYKVSFLPSSSIGSEITVSQHFTVMARSEKGKEGRKLLNVEQKNFYNK